MSSDNASPESESSRNMIQSIVHAVEPSSVPDDADDDAAVVNSTEDSASLEIMMESLVRITFAGFGASMVGLALEKQRQRPQQPIRRMPRTAMKQPVKAQSLPLTWALSGMVFVGVLESCRLTSPTSALWDVLHKQDLDTDTLVERYNYRKAATVAIGDYTMGGSIAGLAGAIGSRRRQMILAGMRQVPGLSWLGWGFGTGMALGLVAGVCQAAIEVGNLYILEQQEQENGTISNIRSTDREKSDEGA